MSLRRLLASASVIAPAARSASIAICLPGIASKVKRAATSATRPAPLVMTMYWMTIRIKKMTETDDQTAADNEVAEALDHLAGVAVCEHETGCADVERKTGTSSR